jgi:ABC-type glutathione transport system ATPase component
MSNSILQIRDLRVTFNTQVGELKAVRGIDVDVAPGEILGVVGESGSGKSVSFLAAMGLLPSSATISGSVMLDGKELIGAKRKAIRSVRGKSLAMVFQDPLSSLHPQFRVGAQIADLLR